MNPEVVYGGCTVVGAVMGWIARGAYNAGRLKSLVDQHSESIGKLTEHSSDTDIHIVRGREDRVIATLHEAINSGFGGVYKRLDNIDSRCERRLADCQQHFSRVDTKIAAGLKGGEGK